MSQQTEFSVSDATVHILCAMHALAHGMLTDQEKDEVAAAGVGLSPELWTRACDLFAEADQAGAGCQFDLGCEDLVLSWLGFPDESAFATTFGGCTVSDAFEAALGSLTALAYFVETLEPPGGAGEQVRYAIARVWCRRVRVLAEQRPRSLSSICEAIDRALACPPETSEIRWCLRQCQAEIAHVAGDERLERRARDAIDALEREDAGATECEAAVHTMSARIVCACWFLAHGRGLVSEEREFTDLTPSGDSAWSELRRALLESDWDSLPSLPVGFFRHWIRDRTLLTEGVCVDCLRASAWQGLLPEIVSAVEILLGGGDCVFLSARGPSYVVEALIERRVQLEAGWTPCEGAPPIIWYEAHQGVRRPETLERVDLIRDLHCALARAGDIDPFARQSVYLDRALEARSRGDVGGERAAFEVAAELAGDDRSEQALIAAVGLAVLTWREGDAQEADRQLALLPGTHAAHVRSRIAAKQPERDRLRHALRAFAASTDLRGGARLAWAHQDAGHDVRALEVGRALVERFHDEPAALAVVGGLLFEQGRFRDSVIALRRALAGGFEPILGEGLLVQALESIGDDGAQDLQRLHRRAEERGVMLVVQGRDLVPLDVRHGTES